MHTNVSLSVNVAYRCRQCLVVVLIPAAVAISACSRGAQPDLLVVDLPDLSGMAPPVQDQMRQAFDRLQRARADSHESNSDRAAAYGDLGRLFLAAESFFDAEPCFINASALSPDDHRWPYYLAHVYRLQGESRKAAASFERALMIHPDNLAALVWLGEVYLDQGRLDEADARFTSALSRQPRVAAARYGLGRVALARHDPGTAIDQLETALALDRRATVIYYSLATAYREAGKTDLAIARLSQKGDGEVGPPDPLMEEVADLLRSPIAYERRGERALGREDSAAAVSEFRRGLELNPDSLSLRQKLGTSLWLVGDAGGAVAQFDDLLRRSPEYAPAHYSLGVVLLSRGHIDEAIERFSRAVRDDPTYLQARLQLANTLRLRGRFEPSLREYAEVIETDPRIGEARFGEALALVRLKRFEEARARLIEAARLLPDRPEFLNALARLYAAAPDARIRNGEQALQVAQQLVGRQQTLSSREAMAMALAEAGRYDEAARWQQETIGMAQRAGLREALPMLSEDLRSYEQRRPCRLPWRAEPEWDVP
jgi:tetratricopeptide (TPR) repeat protein